MLVVVILIITPQGAPFAATADPARQIVIFVDGTPQWLQEQIVMLLGGPQTQIIHVLSLINALAVQFPLSNLTTIDQSLLSNPSVVGVYADLVGLIDLEPPLAVLTAPPVEDFEWGQYHIGIPKVYNHGNGVQGAGVTVAVLDSGIYISQSGQYHPDLAANIVGGFNAIAEGQSYNDDNGHGTHIAGIITATVNGQGIIGTAAQAQLMAVKVLDATGSGYLSDFINGLQWVRNHGIRVLNMSLSFARIVSRCSGPSNACTRPERSWSPPLGTAARVAEVWRRAVALMAGGQPAILRNLRRMPSCILRPIRR